MQPLRIGILGIGRIAERLARCAPFAPSATIAAAASRDLARAEAFATRHDVPKIYGSYEALMRDEEIELVYIATPHPSHEEQTLMALDAGKHVLCEKPMALNAVQARRMAARAREHGLFLMEAMWTRCFPATEAVRAMIREGVIGQPLLATASFCGRGAFNPASRLYAPELGGGALLDVGVYTIAFASMALGGGAPEVTGVAVIGESGVDELASIALRYPSGGVAALTCAARVDAPETAAIYGTEGSIAFGVPFWKPMTFTLSKNGQSEIHAFPREGEGFQYELEHVAACVRAGLTESPLMPLDETLSIAATMDELRARWDLRYPGE